MNPEQLRIIFGLVMAALVFFIIIRFTANWLVKKPGPKMRPIKHVRNWNRERGTR